MAEPAKSESKPKSGWLNLVVDYGPILVFFLVYRHFSPSDHSNPIGEMLAVVKSTGAFMVAAVTALVVSRWRLGRISPMLWLSTLLIVGFGGLTILLRDPFYIQIKPTAIYIMFGAVLVVGARRGQAYLKYLLEAAFEGLDEQGWLKLSRNWGIFFFFLAALNEVLRQFYNVENGNFGTWIALKLWLFMPLSFLFTFTQLPMLLRHGLLREAEEEVITDPPHE
ncbi:inner membrane-spanning protein YciB [Novosphingobium sp.]|uniref:inner membrane-spanning protein YciB n=1 Tax=Novosphingobium sp. TaxID=1874826 RepID=UPI0025DE900F|nr:inner membrane-spanning protein YciB [Novosphingobium sp.]MCC6926390.1 septation protein IspZ [Novosphingobium sp.]